MQTAIQEFATAFTDTAAAIRADQLGHRTPCEQFTVAELLGHVGQVLASSERAARKQPQSDAAAGPATPAEVAEAARRAAAAWAEPAAYQGTTEFGPGEMPADFAAAVTLQELALHGWDLARATGQPFGAGEEAAKAVLSVVQQLAGTARANGGYGRPVAVPDGAGPFHRALAASGRNPGWDR
ncbi:TIGR03086 family metal-binding protein [Kitasatospora sp. LaBMicrA B282]|uniref:TIGR03086 family metal-binding protein n=1 Tax=Kitasatospora sp. LaBMicrA B282 TaxID=3420949 RepID=UPI003D0F33C6